MANTILIKHGDTTPEAGVLQRYELGVVDDKTKEFPEFYVGVMTRKTGNNVPPTECSKLLTNSAQIDINQIPAQETDWQGLNIVTKSNIYESSITVDQWELPSLDNPQQEGPLNGPQPDGSYNITITCLGVAPNTIQEILPGMKINAEQAKAFSKLQFFDNGQDEGKIYLKIYGKKPKIDLPIRIIVRTDGRVKNAANS